MRAAEARRAVVASVCKERDVLIPAFKNKTKNISIDRYYPKSTFFTLWILSKISHKNTTASLPPKDMMILLKKHHDLRNQLFIFE